MKMKPADPSNFGLQNRCSTAELSRQNAQNTDEIRTSSHFQGPGTGGIDGTQQRFCQPQNQDHSFPARSLIDGLLTHAFGHSDTAARQARKIAVALQQWPNKTEANQAYERPLLLKDIDALSEMMGGRA